MNTPTEIRKRIFKMIADREIEPSMAIESYNYFLNKLKNNKNER